MIGAGPRLAPRPEPAPPPPDLSPELRRVLSRVERGAGSLAELVTDPADGLAVAGALGELELRGLVRRVFGGRYIRAATYASTLGCPGVPAVLTIAGSDSGGGAGIQADLKAFAACGVHGMQRDHGADGAEHRRASTDVHTVPPAFIVEQVRAVQDDIGVDAVKIGMLGTAATVAAVSRALDLLRPGHAGGDRPRDGRRVRRRAARRRRAPRARRAAARRARR